MDARQSSDAPAVRSAAALRRGLHNIDGRGYKAYKALLGTYQFPGFDLVCDHIQGDPYASPSHIRIQVAAEVAEFPRELHRDRIRRIALQDFLIRCFADRIPKEVPRVPRNIIGGVLSIDRGGQEVLERSALVMERGRIEVRCLVSLPGDSRRVAGKEAAVLLCDAIPRLVDGCLVYRNLPRNELRRFVEVVEDQCYLRRQLHEAGLVAFVADGSLLPRRSGVDDMPLPQEQVVPFQSPESLRVTLETPNSGPLTGMGITRGVTLIVGGGFHGKSTLLNAIERSVYNHIPGDGRERVVTTQCAVKIRAEDGRYVSNVNISDFIGRLPGGVDTQHFSSTNASGSTSQAANIVEAIEVGATALLMDEDTCASNFMIRDERMQALVAKDKEPIIPFVDRVQGLFKQRGVSTLLVMGGSGDYIEVVDTVLMMDEYRAVDRTADAREVMARIRSQRRNEGAHPLRVVQNRIPYAQSIDPSKGRRAVSIAARSRQRLQFGCTEIDLTALSQLVDISQTRAIGQILVRMREGLIAGQDQGLAAFLQEMMRRIERDGIDCLVSRPVGYLAAPRRFEVAAALNRLRGVKLRQLENQPRKV